MITTLDIIDLLPGELKARLDADEFFEDIPVVVAEQGNVAAMIAERQAVLSRKTDKRGVAVIVLQIVADDEIRPQFGPLVLRPAFQVVENLELNRDASGTGKSARRVCRRMRDIFKGGHIPGLVIDLQADKPFIEPVNLGKEMGGLINAYQQNWRCLEKQTDSLQQAQMPQFVSLAPAAQFAITCPTENATIFYTTDESYPAAGNPTATEYAIGEPIDIPIPAGGGPATVTVRACAYVPGMIASWVNRKTLTAI
jgi:hypothetical protein